VTEGIWGIGVGSPGGNRGGEIDGAGGTGNGGGDILGSTGDG